MCEAPVDYTFYKTVYFGNTITEDDFPRLAARAMAFLQYYTRGRAAAAIDETPVKMALCAVAEQCQIVDANHSRAVSEDGQAQSESVGSWSVSYRSGEDAAQSARAQMKNAAAMYLSGTGLLYRGGRRCECDCRTL